MRTLLVVGTVLASAMAMVGGTAASSAVGDPRPASFSGALNATDAVPTPKARAAAADPATDAAHVLVMRIYWSATPPPSPDDATMRTLMKDAAAWFKRVSRGRHHVTSVVTPWLEVDGGDSNCADLEASLERALAAAQDRGVSTAGYNRFMVVSPQCASTSFGELSGQVTWIREAKPYLAVLLHELGHNLGLDHANSSICVRQQDRVTHGGQCTNQEYGDMWSAMGLSTRPYSVPQLQHLGWAGRVATTRGPGTWTLRDAERSGRGIQALRVRSGGVSYWIEFHTNPVALAASAGTIGIRGVPGVVIRLDSGAGPLLILDAAPGNPDQSLTFPDPDFVDVALPVGRTFTTPEGVRITLRSQHARSATVRVA